MAVETYEGVHATCADHVESILREGFRLSPEERYVGAAVYFYLNNERGRYLASLHLQEKLKKTIEKGGCPDGDSGTFLFAQIEADEKKILDLTEKDKIEGLKQIENVFWQEYDQYTTMPRAEKYKKLNRRRQDFLMDVCQAKPYDLVKVAMPIGKEYGPGLAVFNVDCIISITNNGDATWQI